MKVYVMSEDEFWKLIDASRPKNGCNPDQQAQFITDALAKRSRQEIIDFENLWLQILHRLYTWPILKANFVLQSYVSDDVFEDFRHWIILNGRENDDDVFARMVPLYWAFIY